MMRTTETHLLNVKFDEVTRAGGNQQNTSTSQEFILCFVKEHIYHQHSGLVTLALSFSPFEAFSLSGEPLIQTKLKHV